ncbi:MAG: hypothetical protein OXC40_01355 [Proteobacteria bacterium]|nr:hypothetical protein [Pseudomonadota bacterium]
MKNLIIFLVMGSALLMSSVVFADTGSWFFDEMDLVSQEVIGTPPRKEVEVKFALDGSSFSTRSLGKAIHQLTKQATKTQLSFGQTVGCRMNVDKKIQTFAFIDDYFDTADHKLVELQSSYRMRKRWKKYQHYLRSQLFFWSKLFPPSRIEIQGKTGYQSQGQEISVFESRFEFRRQSPPFNDDFPLPELTSLSDQFLHQLARTGIYEGYVISPFFALLKHPGFQQKDYATFGHQISLLSQRHRFHVNCPHPLGSGPEPDQVFIITLDEVSCLTRCCHGRKLVTIEIERERNTSTLLDEIKFYESSDHFNHPLARRAFAYTKSLRNAYEGDHKILTDLIEDLLKQWGLHILPVLPKYHRFSC